MNKIFLNNIGDLVEAQRASFYRFLYKGISEELTNFPNPFVTRIKVPTRLDFRKKFYSFVYLSIDNIKFKGPYYTFQECLDQDLTYSIYLYVPGQYSYHYDSYYDNHLLAKKVMKKKNNLKFDSLKFIVKQDILFGEIPLITDEGSFIINGCERITVSQIIRCPGVYFQKEFSTTKKVSYVATIISDKGLWTRIFYDVEGETGRKKVEDEKRIERIYIRLNDYKRNGNSETKEKDKTDENFVYLYELLNYFGLSNEEIYDSLKYPSLLKTHRLTRVNKKKNEQEESKFSLKKKPQFFNQKSGYFSIGELGRYKVNKQLGLNLPNSVTYLTALDFINIINGLVELKYFDKLSDDIDHIKNKEIRSIGELLQNQIRIAFFKLKKTYTEALAERKTVKPNFETENDYENDYEVDEYILIDPRPVTNTIKEFFVTSQLSQFMDQTNPLAELTHKRRVSVFGPNGLKRDHISTVIRDIHPSQYGRLCPIETPEGQNAGLITSLSIHSRINSLGWIETPYFFSDNSIVFANKSPIFLNPEQESQVSIAFADTLLNTNYSIPKEYLSVKEDYLFLLKKVKDINFITTSPLQLISLATALIPFIEHDDANRALMGSNMQRQAVPLIYSQKPIVGTGFESASILDSQMITKSYSKGIVISADSATIVIKDFAKQRVLYRLRKYKRSNQETCINQKPIVWLYEKIFSGQVISDGASTNEAELALGKNLTIAYMPWEGYNYEDAIIINERLIIDDCLTSIHIEEYETALHYSLLGNQKITRNLPHLTKYVRRHLNNSGIVRIGSYVKEDDILVGKVVPAEESFLTKIFKALYKDNKPSFKDISLRVSHGTEGRVIAKKILVGEYFDRDNGNMIAYFSERIKIYVAQRRKIQVGDKLAGRHGNKGIISRILSRQDMPFLPNGIPIDIIFNPLGVPSRMNVGQVFECLLGLAGEHLGTRFKISPFDEIYGKEASRVLVNQKLKEAAIKSNLKWLFNSYSPGKILLRDGRTGEFFDNPITVGKTYILKLIHLVDDKIHARATGPYSMITEQPLAGKSQKGGQRFGEMEVWALEAYGASSILQELLTIKSDDIDGRNDIYESIVFRNDWEKRTNPSPSIPEGFLVLIRELNALGLDFTLNQIKKSNRNQYFNSIKRDVFSDLEKKLKLRAILAHQKAEKLFTLNSLTEEQKDFFMTLLILEYQKLIKPIKESIQKENSFRNERKRRH